MTTTPDDEPTALSRIVADLIAHCPEHGTSTETWMECRCDAARKAAATIAAATQPEPRQTRRDVSWTVMFRLARTGVWVEWSSGHRDPAEAVQSAEAIVSISSVADIRFDRITHTRETFSLHDLPAAGGGAR